jgi:hypothetical protein
MIGAPGSLVGSHIVDAEGDPSMNVADLRRAVFARHAHPVSAWTRLLTTPLVVAPFWSKKPAVAGSVAVWFAINPIMTPEPARRDTFATRAILGEEIWLTAPDRDRSISTLNLAGAIVLGVASLAAWHRRRVPTAIGVTASMAITLYSWSRYAALYDADHAERPE